MSSHFKAICVAATMIIGSTAMASAQNATDSRGNAMGSERVGTGGGAAGGAAMQAPAGGTMGMSTGQAARDNPNGTAGAPPKSHTGPQGDPSKSEDGKR